MKRPLAVVVCVYAAGILAADLFALPLPMLLGSGIVLAALGLWNDRTPTLICLLAVAGAANMTFRSMIVSPNDLRVLTAETPALVTVRGQLRRTPYQRVHRQSEEESSRSLAELEVFEIQKSGEQWQPAAGYVMTSTSGILPAEYTAGTTVEIQGVMQRPPGAVIEGLFDYERYLQRRGVYRQLRCSEIGDWTIQGEPRQSGWSDRFMSWAKVALARGLPVEDEPLRLIWAMDLGWQTALSGEVSEPFMRSGTMHIFAISGLHMALIASVLVFVLRVFSVPRRYCAWIVIPLLWFYTGATGWQASAVRSTLMSSVLIAGWTLKRPSDIVNSLAGAALIILLWDPQQLFQAGFILSFAVVLSLALFGPVLETIRPSLLEPEPFRPLALRSWLLKTKDETLRRIRLAAVVSLAAWLGSTPLVAHYFNLFTPIGLLANLIIVPLSGLAMASSMASLLLSIVLPAAAELFNHSSWFLMLCMMQLSEWFAALPGGTLHVARPGVFIIAIYYVTLTAVMAGWVARPTLRRWLIALLALLAAGWIVQKCLQSSSAELTVVRANAGHVVFARPAFSNDESLIDCGNEFSAQFLTKSLLAARGVNWLSRVLLTHGDIQHIGGMEYVKQRFWIGDVYLPAVQFRSPIYRELSQKYHRAKRLRRGDRAGPWTVLHPDENDRFTQADDAAMVVKAEIGGATVLLLSDLGRLGQRRLLERNPDLRADIVVIGFPERGEPLVEPLLQAIRPRLIIMAEAGNPISERRSRSVRQRLAASGAEIVDLYERGAVTVRLKRGAWQISNRLKPALQHVNSGALSEPQQSGSEE